MQQLTEPDKGDIFVIYASNLTFDFYLCLNKHKKLVDNFNESPYA